jgi:predicted dienelactone hydrolase
MKRLLPLFIILSAACSSQQNSGGYQQQITPLKIGDYSAEAGPSPVGVIPIATLHDAQRNKDLEISVDYPTRGGPFPVIVFSHGYGGSSQGYEPLVSYWASNGYVVIRPSHADAGALRELARETMRDVYQQRTDDERQRRQRRPQPNPQTTAQPQPFRANPMETIWEKEREPQWRDRVADIRLVLDSVNDLENRFPELRGKVDASRIGVAGHSYGAFAAMLIGGAQTFGNPPLQLADPRVKAIVAMSPQGAAANRGLTAQSWTNLRIPAMFMTGSEDRGALESEDPNWRKQAYDYSPAGDKYFVLIQGARHSSFTGSSSAAFDVPYQRSPYPSSNPNMPQQTANGQPIASPAYTSDRNTFQKIKLTSQLFWDAYLKGQASTRDLLVQEKMLSGVTLTKK